MSSFLKDLRAVPSMYFSPEIKTWVAVSTGVILLLAAGILHKVYQEFQHLLFASDSPYASSNAWFLVSVTIVPVAIAIHRKWTRNSSQTSDTIKAKPILTGIFSGTAFFGLFVLLFQFEAKEVQADYFSRLASFSIFLRESKIYELLAFYIAIDILRPVLEEVVFRGFIFQSIAKKYGLLLGVLISSAGFATIHQGLLGAPIQVFLFGLVSCMFVYFYRSLAASYSLHISYNSLITIFSFIRGA